MGVQALGPELAVERLDEGIVRRLSGPAELDHDAFLVGSEVKFARDELRAPINPDRLGIADLAAYPFKSQNHVLPRQLKRGSTAGENREHVFTFGRMRSSPPLASWSRTQFIVQT